MLLMFSAAAAVLVLDQASKALVLSRLQEGEAAPRTLLGMRLRLVFNRRPWLLARSAQWYRLVAWVAIIAAGTIACGSVSAPAGRIGVGAILGGATGNLLDGLRRRAVTDFIDLRVWPVFNAADAAIVLGTVATCWTVL